jgi:exosortase
MTFFRDLQRQSRLIKCDVLLLALLVILLTVVLWPHWRQNPELSHGLLMPFLFLLLLHESRRHGCPRYTPDTPALTGLLVLAATAGLLMLIAGGLYAAAVGWGHSLVAFTLTAAAASLLGAGLLVCSQRQVRLLPLNWTSLVAIGLWLLCAPIPPGTYSRLTLNLQLAVSSQVLAALNLLGIAASRHGNIIELANTSVGIEEACSGVRSLISCVFAGFFFSATLVRRPWARAIIILLAAPLALVMNFFRSLTLTLLANHGVEIAGTWHDVTGFAVLGITAVILGGLAFLLEPDIRPAAEPSTTAPAGSTRFKPACLGLALLATAGLAGFFVANTRPDKVHPAPAPNLLAVLPAEFEGWHVDTTRDLYQFSGVLKTDHLAQRTYLTRRDGETVQLTVYLAYWSAGQSLVSEVATHTPDACWPGAGWQSVPLPSSRTRARLPLPDGRTLPTAEAREFLRGPFPQYVWFWHIYDGRVIAYEKPNSPAELLRIALHYGFSRSRSQMFVRFSSNRPWADVENEPLVAEICRRLQPLGL